MNKNFEKLNYFPVFIFLSFIFHFLVRLFLILKLKIRNVQIVITFNSLASESYELHFNDIVIFKTVLKSDSLS